MGTLVSIVFSPAPGSFNRQPLATAQLIAGYGIEGDRKGGHPNRNLNIMDQETLEILRAEGFPVAPGVLGENLILDGIRLDGKAEGARIRIGGQAVVEVARLREPCYKLTALDPSMPDSVIGRVGVMARVIESGLIRVGDVVDLA